MELLLQEEEDLATSHQQIFKVQAESSLKRIQCIIIKIGGDIFTVLYDNFQHKKFYRFSYQKLPICQTT